MRAGRLLILASGNGSNFEAIVHHLRASAHHVIGLVCDKRGVPVLDRAARLGVPAWRISYRDGVTAAEMHLEEIIAELKPDIVALAGFMRILSSEFVDRHPEEIINIHPSLLPRYRGLNAIERAYQAGDGELGITIHLVDSGVDTGPIIDQQKLTRDPQWTLEEVQEAIHRLEHSRYPAVISHLLDERVAATQGSPV